MQMWHAVTVQSFNPPVPGSKFGQNIGYPDRGFSWWYSVPPGKFGDSIGVLISP